MPTKKKATAKKTSPETKQTSLLTTTPKTKKTAKPAAKKSVPTVSAGAVKAVASPKKSSPKRKAQPKTSPSHFTKELIPEVPPVSRITPMDTSLFTTVIALFVVALVVLGGYIYSRQARIATPDVPAAATLASEPQRISIASSVALTPEVIEALEEIVTLIMIRPDEVLKSVRSISDVAAAKNESSDFFAEVESGDLVFYFREIAILYRPSTKQIIKTRVVTSQTV